MITNSRSLDSVKELAQEIIVVVKYRTDNTEQIAREEYGAMVYEHDWHGHRDQKISRSTRHNLGYFAGCG